MNNMNNIQVFIPDHAKLNDPEILAMIQAMYSRSDMGIEERLAELNEGDTGTKQARIKKNIQTYVLGYGHNSIADCANVPVFIEGVSMLAAKALQDSPLYNGQERSTRFQDFRTIPLYAETEFSKNMAEKWRGLYCEYLPKIEQWVVNTYASQRDLIMPDDEPSPTKQEAQEKKVKRDALWAKTCKAISFDIARGLLPCGATTSLSMYMSLRKYRDHLTELATHPLAEIRAVAIRINDALYARNPNTFKPIVQNVIGNKPARSFYMGRKVYDSVSHAQVVDRIELGTNGQYLSESDDNTWYGIQGAIDFGSYRDLQRHRNGKNQMPLVSALLGPINDFYHKILKEVDPVLYQRVLDLYYSLIPVSNLGNPSIFELQYAHPMMTQVPVGLFWSKAQLKYVMTLRSKTSVHPTLRAWCADLWLGLNPLEQTEIPIDTRRDYIQSNRGAQDLVRVSEDRAR